MVQGGAGCCRAHLVDLRQEVEQLRAVEEAARVGRRLGGADEALRHRVRVRVRVRVGVGVRVRVRVRFRVSVSVRGRGRGRVRVQVGAPS